MSHGEGGENHGDLSAEVLSFRVSPNSVCFLVVRTPQPCVQGQFPAVSSSWVQDMMARDRKKGA